jgi:hypothetical protein
MSSSALVDSRWTARAALIACALVAFGCGDDDAEDACGEEEEGHSHATCGLQENCTDAVELEEGLRVESEDDKFTVEVLSHEPLSQTENRIVVAIENAAGDRVTDAELDVDVFSVDCMHPGPNPSEAVSAEADGSYELAPVHAHGGPWDTVLEIAAGGETDTARLHFCVPGDEHGDGGAHHDDDDHCH